MLVEVDEPEEFLEALAREGVLATPGKPGYVRLCTHLDVDDDEIEAAVEAAARITDPPAMSPIEVSPVPAIGPREPLRLARRMAQGRRTRPRRLRGRAPRASSRPETSRYWPPARRPDWPASSSSPSAPASPWAPSSPASKTSTFDPEARRRGVGRALLQAANERCAHRGISYVEAQVEEAKRRRLLRGLRLRAGARCAGLLAVSASR